MQQAWRTARGQIAKMPDTDDLRPPAASASPAAHTPRGMPGAGAGDRPRATLLPERGGRGALRTGPSQFAFDGAVD
jgi:hypothetical protein